MLKKSVLLTRSHQDNLKLAAILSIKGYDCVNCSMLQYKNVEFDYSILKNYKNIVITSKYAANLLNPNLFTQCVFVVGKSSAEILKSKNYQIGYVAENALELREYLNQQGRLEAIYLAGNHITIDMPLNVQKHHFYEVHYTNSLSLIELKRIKTGLDYILLYSENCAKTFVKLILENQLLKYVENSVVINISPKVAAVVKRYFTNSFACKGAIEMLNFLEIYDRKR